MLYVNAVNTEGYINYYYNKVHEKHMGLMCYDHFSTPWLSIRISCSSVLLIINVFTMNQTNKKFTLKKKSQRQTKLYTKVINTNVQHNFTKLIWIIIERAMLAHRCICFHVPFWFSSFEKPYALLEVCAGPSAEWFICLIQPHTVC